MWTWLLTVIGFLDDLYYLSLGDGAEVSRSCLFSISGGLTTGASLSRLLKYSFHSSSWSDGLLRNVPLLPRTGLLVIKFLLDC